MHEKLKSIIESQALLLCTVVLVVAVSAFYLGRLSVLHVLPSNGPIVVPRVVEVSPNESTTSAAVQVISPEVLRSATAVSAQKESDPVVASSGGTKYHYYHCAGAKQIKETNKLYFENAAAAEAAGYTRAANCVPME